MNEITKRWSAILSLLLVFVPCGSWAAETVELVPNLDRDHSISQYELTNHEELLFFVAHDSVNGIDYMYASKAAQVDSAVLIGAFDSAHLRGVTDDNRAVYSVDEDGMRSFFVFDFFDGTSSLIGGRSTTPNRLDAQISPNGTWLLIEEGGKLLISAMDNGSFTELFDNTNVQPEASGGVFSPNDRFVVINGGGTALLYDLLQPGSVPQALGPSSQIRFADDNRIVIARDGQFLSLDPLDLVSPIPLSPAKVPSTYLTAAGRFIYRADSGGVFQLESVDVSTGQSTTLYDQADVSGFWIAPDETTMLFASDDALYSTSVTGGQEPVEVFRGSFRLGDVSIASNSRWFSLDFNSHYPIDRPGDRVRFNRDEILNSGLVYYSESDVVLFNAANDLGAGLIYSHPQDGLGFTKRLTDINMSAQWARQLSAHQWLVFGSQYPLSGDPDRFFLLDSRGTEVRTVELAFDSDPVLSGHQVMQDGQHAVYVGDSRCCRSERPLFVVRQDRTKSVHLIAPAVEQLSSHENADNAWFLTGGQRLIYQPPAGDLTVVTISSGRVTSKQTFPGLQGRHQLSTSGQFLVSDTAEGVQSINLESGETYGLSETEQVSINGAVAFASDQERVLFVERVFGVGGGHRLVSAGLDAQLERTILSPIDGSFEIRFLPTTDGRVVFEKSGDFDGDQLLVVDVEGLSPPIVLAEGSAELRVWALSPSDKWIVYSQGPELFVVDTFGRSTPRSLELDESYHFQGFYPNGQTVLFYRNKESHRFDLTRWHIEASTDDSLSWPYFSADGTKVFSAPTLGPVSVYDGTTLALTTILPQKLRNPLSLPDSDFVVGSYGGQYAERGETVLYSLVDDSVSGRLSSRGGFRYTLSSDQNRVSFFGDSTWHSTPLDVGLIFGTGFEDR